MKRLLSICATIALLAGLVAAALQPGGAVQAAPVPAPALTLWSPPLTDQPAPRLFFDYKAAKPGTYKLQLQYRLAGSPSFRSATIDRTSFKAAATGNASYSFLWRKQADGVAAGVKADLQLSVTDAKGKTDRFLLRNYAADTNEKVRNGVGSYLIYYGDWSDKLVDEVKGRYDLIILKAQKTTAAQIRELRSGANPADAGDDAAVIGYFSVGEDERTAGMSPEQMRTDKRFVLDGTGPSVDPRPGAPYPDGGPWDAPIDPEGKPTNGGFAPFYLNDNYLNNRIGKAKTPDFNAKFKAAFVNAGHPLWFKAAMEMTVKRDRVPGIRELMTTCALDGVFLDTLDTVGPNGWTNADSFNQSEFEWTGPGIHTFVRKLRAAYPSALLVQNRGLFFYQPDLPMYAHTLRPYVDFVLFESFRKAGDTMAQSNTAPFNDNKYNYAQKLLAEADRADGFRTLSLDYAHEAKSFNYKQALRLKPAARAPQALLDDIEEAYVRLGMIHYISDWTLTDLNTFVRDRSGKPAAAPVWGSTKTPPFGKPFDAPREGVQAAAFEGGRLVVKWDVAHAQARPVRYSLYVKEGEPFDWAAGLKEQSVKVVQQLPLDVPDDYAGSGDREARYPYEAAIEGLDPQKTYYVVIRAAGANGVYEANRRMLKVAP